MFWNYVLPSINLDTVDISYTEEETYSKQMHSTRYVIRKFHCYVSTADRNVAIKCCGFHILEPCICL